ncbi:lymphocyte-specific helicase-like [Styela clava]
MSTIEDSPSQSFPDVSEFKENNGTSGEESGNDSTAKDNDDDELYIPSDEEDIPEQSMITKEMVEEEEMLEKKEMNLDEKIEDFKPISTGERLDRLALLLQKSKVYANSLLKVIEKKKEVERKKAKKKEKLLKKQKLMKKGDLASNTALKRQRSPNSDEKNRNKRIKLTDAKADSSHNDILQQKLYLPTPENIVSQIIEVDGIRYYGNKMVDLSQPSLLTGGMLRKYQIVGFQWLKVLFTNAVNGILADEMGLGKTIQCIALICQIIKMGFKGPFIVCAPLSTIANWINEFKTFAPQIPLLLYHGNATERAVLARHIKDIGQCVESHPVVITSYEILINDRAVLSAYHWEYLILDEGHRIKNTKCRLLKELKQLNIGAKLLLTGTPLQNNLTELWSLLNFIIPEVFDDLRVFESWFNFGETGSKGSSEFTLDQEEKFLSTMYEILTPFLLRRVKNDVDIDLPPKKEVIVYAPFSQKQKTFYEAATTKTIQNLFEKNKTPEPDLKSLMDISNRNRQTRSKTLDSRIENERAKNSVYCEDTEINVSLNNIVMLLRKCCNHPYLIEYPLIPGTDIFKVDENLVSASGKLMLLDRLLPKLKEHGHKVLIFSQMTKMMDILQDYCGLRQYTTVRLDGSTNMQDRQQNIKNFNRDPDIFVFLLSTKAGGLGINLTSADTVIIYDSDWNPQNDLQAQDRCHRIGQTKPVMIYRLVTASSIDQRMVERAAEKRKLEKLVMHENKFKGNLDLELKHKTTIGRSELLEMIRSPHFNAVVNSQDIMTDEQLEKLLDRSSLTN